MTEITTDDRVLILLIKSGYTLESTNDDLERTFSSQEHDSVSVNPAAKTYRSKYIGDRIPWTLFTQLDDLGLQRTD